MRRCLVVCCLLVATALPGCGTVLGRSNADWIGSYPGDAIAFDFALIASAFGGDEGGSSESGSATNFVLGFVSLPFDLVFDVVLLPADLIGWLFGLHKNWPNSG